MIIAVSVEEYNEQGSLGEEQKLCLPSEPGCPAELCTHSLTTLGNSEHPARSDQNSQCGLDAC